MQIQPKLSALDTTMIVISLIIGAGIFRTPSEVALKAGSVGLLAAGFPLSRLFQAGSRAVSGPEGDDHD